MKKLPFSCESLFLTLFLLGGCQGEDGGGSDSATSLSIEEKVELLCSDTTEAESNCAAFSESLLLSIENHSYLAGDFVKVHNNAGYPSDVAIGNNVAVYVNSESAEDFLKVDPDTEGSYVEVEIGTTIIREVWDESSMVKYTAMIKMEAGYFPEGGDFSYVEVDIDNSIITGGKNQDCGGCHLERATDGYLWGVHNEFKTDLNDSEATPREEEVTDNEFIEAETKMMELARQAMNFNNYLGSDFIKVNDEAFLTALGDSSGYIDVYVSDFGYEEFIKANPESAVPVDISLPEDTVIVRTVANELGELDKFTLMVKGPEGYYPDGGDFYYGVFDINEEVLVNSDGRAREGALTECGSCHDTWRKNSAYLFGVAPSVLAL